jgi:hypothetical protein
VQKELPHMPGSRSSARRVRALIASLALILAIPAGAAAADAPFPNPADPYVALTPAAAGGQVVPLINSGDVYQGVTFEGIPDGIGAVPTAGGVVDLYVNFEQSHVPFGGFADLEDSSVQRVRVDLAAKQVTELEEVLSPDAGYIRFCSAFMGGPDQGFSDYTLFLNEESNDWIDVPAGADYGADPAIAPYRQAGYGVWLDTATGESEPL